MKKTLFALLLSSSFSFADYLYGTTGNCIKSYYYYNGNCFIVSSATGVVTQITTKNIESSIYPDYEYNTTSGRCSKVSSNNDFGMDNQDFVYLNSMIGIIVAFLMVWSIF